MASSRKNKGPRVPTWISGVYTIFAILLVPWTVYLAYSLPKEHVLYNWDTAWVGLDIAIMLALLLTGFLAAIKSKQVALSAAIAGTFILTDAWFDIIGSSHHGNYDQAVVLAIFVEVPLAIVNYMIAYRVIKN